MMVPAIVYTEAAPRAACTYVLDLWPENLYSVLPVKTARCALWRRASRIGCTAAAMPFGHERCAGRKAARHCAAAHSGRWCRSIAKTYAQDVHDEALAALLPGAFAWCLRATSAPRRTLACLSRAPSALPHRAARDIHFCIVGDGMSRAQLEADIGQRRCAEYFTFEGMQPVERIPAYHTMAGALFAALAKATIWA